MYSTDVSIDEFKGRYEGFFEKEKDELGHYFRVLYNILKFVRDRCQGNKKFYSNIVRAQLTYAEVELIYYNSVSKYGEEKLKPLVEEFAILKHLALDDVANREIMNYY
jgi:hypothetical protein